MKNTYYFIKVLSVLFLLSGLSFLFTDKYFLSAIAIASFVIVVFADSDWVFDRLKISNPTSVTLFVTFVLLLVNGYFIFTEMSMSSIKLTPQQQKAYFDYDKEVYNIFSDCMNLHNNLMTKVHLGEKATTEEVKKVNSVCFDAVASVDKNALQGEFPATITKLVEKNKTELKKVAVNLSAYNYSAADAQELLIKRVKTSLDIYGKNINTLKLLIDPKEEYKADYAIMIKI